jgi:uncharacterized membrane protein (DUF4010 family)
VLNPDLVLPLVPYLVAPAAVAVIAAAFGATRPDRDGGGGSQPENTHPLQLTSALQMAALFQFVIIAVNLARQTWGQAGVLTTAAVLGLTDVDALTVSMSRGAAQSGSLPTAAEAIADGVLANTEEKSGIAFVLGAAPFRVVTGGTLAAMIAAAALSIVVLM